MGSSPLFKLLLTLSCLYSWIKIVYYVPVTGSQGLLLL